MFADAPFNVEKNKFSNRPPQTTSPTLKGGFPEDFNFKLVMKGLGRNPTPLFTLSLLTKGPFGKGRGLGGVGLNLTPLLA